MWAALHRRACRSSDRSPHRAASDSIWARCYLALWSLAVAFFFSLVIFAYDPIGKGQLGWTIRAPSLDVPGLNWLHDLLVPGAHGHFDFSRVPDQILLFLALFGVLTR